MGVELAGPGLGWVLLLPTPVARFVLCACGGVCVLRGGGSVPRMTCHRISHHNPSSNVPERAQPAQVLAEGLGQRDGLSGAALLLLPLERLLELVEPREGEEGHGAVG